MRTIEVNGVGICTDAYGDPSDPAIVLISGAGNSMDWWEPAFCERLAGNGRQVIRYDHRDTGQSASYPPGAPAYSIDDLVADVVGILDAYDIDRAHVVGLSLGGMIAQRLVLVHPGRVRSLTLMSTSPGPGDADLPPRAARLAGADGADPDWSDVNAVTDYFVRWQRATAAQSEPFDADGVRAIANAALTRTTNLESSLTNHHAMSRGKPWRHRLSEIAVPTLVLHGREDPVVPDGHGTALAREIPGARLVLLDGVGHELPERAWDTVVAEITALTATPG